MGTLRHWQTFWSTTRVCYIGQCWYFNPQWTAGQARNKASCVANSITHWQVCTAAMCRHMNQGFWRGLGGGGDQFWLQREILNFKVPAAYQNTAVFQIGVNTKFLQTSTCYATPLWVVRLFKWLTARPLYGSFGIKGLNSNIPINKIFFFVSWFVGHSVSQITPSRTQDSSHSVGIHNYSLHLTALHFSITEFYI